MDNYSGRAIARNTIFSLSGQIAPLIVGIATIPVIIRQLGTDRFGVLVLGWAIIGYYSIFDLGLGSALTKLTSEKIASKRNDVVPALFWTGSAMLFALGCLGMVIVFVLAPIVVHSILKIPNFLIHETLGSLKILGGTLPIVLLTSGMFGYLAANHRFDLINYIRIPLGIMNFLSPILILQVSPSLTSVLLVLAVTRIVLLMISIWMCLTITPGLRRRLSVNKEAIGQLFSFGIWVTVSNIVSPLMLAIDRFFIGSIVSIKAVAFYATPYDLLTKVLTIPGSVAYVLFPTFSAANAVDKKKSVEVYFRGLKYTYLILFPFVFFIILFSHELLQLWIGTEFADNSYLVLQILGIGVLINGLSLIPFAFLQGVGRPDIIAKLHTLEFILYAIVLAYLVRQYGIIGAAVSWDLRVLIDGLALAYFSAKYSLDTKIKLKPSALVMVGSIGIFVISMALSSPSKKIMFFAGSMTVFIFVAWKRVLEDSVKGMLIRSLKGFLS